MRTWPLGITSEIVAVSKSKPHIHGIIDIVGKEEHQEKRVLEVNFDHENDLVLIADVNDFDPTVITITKRQAKLLAILISGELEPKPEPNPEPQPMPAQPNEGGGE